MQKNIETQVIETANDVRWIRETVDDFMKATAIRLEEHAREIEGIKRQLAQMTGYAAGAGAIAGLIGTIIIDLLTKRIALG